MGREGVERWMAGGSQERNDGRKIDKAEVTVVMSFKLNRVNKLEVEIPK